MWNTYTYMHEMEFMSGHVPAELPLPVVDKPMRIGGVSGRWPLLLQLGNLTVQRRRTSPGGHLRFRAKNTSIPTRSSFFFHVPRQWCDCDWLLAYARKTSATSGAHYRCDVKIVTANSFSEGNSVDWRRRVFVVLCACEEDALVFVCDCNYWAPIN